MTGDTEIDLQALIADWQTPPAPATPAAEIRAYAQRRSRLLVAWMTGELLIGSAVLSFLVHRISTQTDPIERLAMGLLATITAGAMAFGWWNWRGAVRASAQDTRTFVALSTERARRFARNIRASWVVLAAQAVVFIPWLRHRLYADGPAPSRTTEFATWGFLIAMLALGAVFVLALQAWARRDAAAFAQIRRELESDGGEA
jgi:hypothetical protein